MEVSYMFTFIKEKPVLVYDGHNLENEIQRLEELMPKLNDEGQSKILNDIKLKKIGLSGEKKIIFELLNSHIPMYIFHDVYLEHEGLNAQIDFIILTKYQIFVIEAKDYAGNITINSDGTFIREYNNRKEAIYSPITQNERHIQLINDKIVSRKSTLWRLIARNFIDNFSSIIIFTNPKCIIKKGRAPKQIKDRVIRSDALIDYIKSNNKDEMRFSNTFMTSFIDFIKTQTTTLEHNLENYNKYVISDNLNNGINNGQLKEKLIQYRLRKSKELKLEAYKIFTNQEMELIIQEQPKTIEDLIKIKGFGNYKITNYG